VNESTGLETYLPQGMLTYALTVPNINTFSGNNENRIQNMFLQLANACNRLGYFPVAPFGSDAILLQKFSDGNPDAHFLLLDPYNYGLKKIEVQGIENVPMAIAIGQNINIQYQERRDSKGNFMCYSYTIPGSNTGNSYSMKKERKTVSEQQRLMMLTLDFLLKNYHCEGFTQFWNDQILLRYNPSKPPTKHLLIDLNCRGSKITVEVQGDISENMIEAFLASGFLAECEKVYMDSKNTSYVTAYCFIVRIHEDMSSIKYDNIKQYLMLNVLNLLKDFGYTMQFYYYSNCYSGIGCVLSAPSYE